MCEITAARNTLTPRPFDRDAFDAQQRLETRWGSPYVYPPVFSLSLWARERETLGEDDDDDGTCLASFFSSFYVPFFYAGRRSAG